ncbi:teichuronic acid biosynthesis protein TuaE [Litchfieldia alkalitelluris]|uniref:teichuronic acid biosynthesis protein TuaE n=1 Tax=Litchfieldia alkalitelluris TaxID=304268 RepID=UPI0009973772|nr:O-antigen ligase family protein [Litchfieldia alkalitelluris]
MVINHKLLRITVIGFLLTVLFLVSEALGMTEQMFLFISLWIIIGVLGFIAYYVEVKNIIVPLMFLLICSTFLNQSIFTIHLGFFSLFLYRMLLITVVTLFVLHIFKEKNFIDYWNQVHVKGILLFFLVWIVYGTISLLWVKSLIAGIKYLFLLGIGIAFIFLAVFLLKKLSQLFAVYLFWSVMSMLLLILGCVNHFGHIQLPSSTLYGAPEYKLGYPTAVFFNQNDFATFLTISFFFYFSALKNSRNSYFKCGAFILSGLSVYMIYLTESRASLLAIGVGLIIYVLMIVPSLLKKVIVITSALTITLLFYLNIEKIYSILLQLSEASTESTSSNVVRLNLIKNTFAFFIESFGFGVGVGNLPFYLENQAIYDTNHVVEVHNWLVEIIGNFGWGIFLGYLTMYIYLIHRLYCFYKKRLGNQAKWLVEAAILSLIAFLVSSISPSSVSNLFFHWVFLGFVISLLSVLRGKESQDVIDNWHEGVAQK